MENLLALQTLFTVDCRDMYSRRKRSILAVEKCGIFHIQTDRETERQSAVLEDEDNDSQDWSVWVAKYQSASIKLTL